MDKVTENNDNKQTLEETVQEEGPKLLNGNLKELKEDHLYHIALSNMQHDLRQLFGDVKFVCFGGQASRMEKFTTFVATKLGIVMAKGTPQNHAENTDRFAVYKAGPVLAVSHGIGIPSLSTVFQEILKLTYYAGCRNLTFFRIGTSGGLGVKPGTVVISEDVVNGSLEPLYKATVLGKKIDHPAKVDKTLVEELYLCAKQTDKFKTIKGTTLCADDFYEGQGRIDGAFCEYEDKDKLAWLHSINSEGVTNMEMESLGFIVMCHRASIRGSVCCVTLLDRFNGDGITTDRQLLAEWQSYPQILVSRYIKQKLSAKT